MPRKKKPVVEIVRLPEAVLAPSPTTAHLQAVLDRMVRQRVDEIMAERGDVDLEPDFQSKEVAYELQRRQTVFDRKKWRLYFEEWGCRMCQRKKWVSHASSGHCSRCVSLMNARLAKIKRRFEEANPETEIDRQIDRISSRLRSAQELLGEIEK
jgi:hypothetical protein